jgi:hypothetical protein
VSVSYRSNAVDLAPDALQFVAAACPAGQVAVGGSASGGDALVLRFQEPGDEGGRDFGSWHALFENPGDTPQTASVLAICIAATNVSGLPPE